MQTNYSPFHSGHRHFHRGHSHADSIQMTDGPIARQLLAFTLPILLSQLLQQFYNIADTAMIGRLIGADALAATGTAGLLLSVIINFFIGLSAGISVIISQLFGHQEYDRLRGCIRTVLSACFLFGLFFTAAGLLGMNSFLVWLDTPAEIIPLACDYLKICFLGMAAQLLYNVGTAILRALGNTTSALYYLAVSSVLNLLLNFLFLVVTPLGICGAALATLLSQSLSALCVLWKLFTLKDPALREAGAGKTKLPLLEPCYLILSLRKGIPAGMQALFMSISSLVIQTYINSFGYAAMAGMTVYAKVEGFLYFPLFSFGLALTSFIGQNVGAGRYDRVREGMKISMRLAVIGSIGAAILLLLTSSGILSLFTRDSFVLKNGLEACIFTFPFYWLYAINQVYIGGLRGLGQTFYPMFTSLCSYCLFRVLWCRFWDFAIHDMRVVYTSYDVSWVLMLALLFFGYRYYFNRSLHGSAERPSLPARISHVFAR